MADESITIKCETEEIYEDIYFYLQEMLMRYKGEHAGDSIEIDMNYDSNKSIRKIIKVYEK